MKKIEISIEVHKWIEMNRVSFDESENDILLRISKQDKQSEVFIPFNVNDNLWNVKDGLTWKGVFLRNGMKLKKEYKGKLYTAEIINNQIVLNNKSFHSPSAAAIEVTGTSVNGWIFWEYFNSEKSEWELLNNLRK
jgi:hypothetical protein